MGKERETSLQEILRGNTWKPVACVTSVSYRVTSIARVKERNEEKRKQRNIMARFIESWGLRGSVSSFSLHLPLHSSFHGYSLSPTFAQ